MTEQPQEPGEGATTPPAPSRKRRTHAERWRHEELLVGGYIPVPSLFLRTYAELKPYPLSVQEAMFVLHLMEFKWDADAPFPGYVRLAKRMGVSTRAVRRHAQSLQTKGYLKRIMRVGQTNRFDLSGLFDKLKEAAAEEALRRPARGRRVAATDAEEPF